MGHEPHSTRRQTLTWLSGCYTVNSYLQIMSVQIMSNHGCPHQESCRGCHGHKAASYPSDDGDVRGDLWMVIIKHVYSPDLSRTGRISGLVVEYIVAIDVTRARFLADAFRSRCMFGHARLS